MAVKLSPRTFTVRFPAKLHESISKVADKRRKSLNILIQEITEEYVTREEEKELFDSFTRLGEDMDTNSVEFAWEAQREAIELADKQN